LRSKCFRLTYPLKIKAFYHIPDKKKAVSERVIICCFLTIGGFFDTLSSPDKGSLWLVWDCKQLDKLEFHGCFLQIALEDGIVKQISRLGKEALLWQD
ncbi:MAG: hypothetical protein J6A74_03445, partial [Oscillospiraceae bacterium]|nr:hypothetical protein [Oscillospiraceae bacterium]